MSGSNTKLEMELPDVQSSYAALSLSNSHQEHEFSLAQLQKPLPRSISDYLPHDVKIQILHWAPNVTTLLALVHACPKFLLAFQTAPKVIMTKVTVRQLRENGFDIYHPMLDILHSLNYPDCLVWGQTSPFTSGLKAIHEFVLGRREVLSVEQCLGLLSEGHDTYYIYWLIAECISRLKKARV